MILFGGLSAAAFYGFDSLPKGFVPEEDQGWAMYSIQLPDAASRLRTVEVVETLSRRLAKMPGIKTWLAVPGYSLMDGAVTSNNAAIWAVFDP